MSAMTDITFTVKELKILRKILNAYFPDVHILTSLKIKIANAILDNDNKKEDKK